MEEIKALLGKDEDVALAFSRLNSKTQKSIINFVKRRINKYINEISLCESPIEEMLGAELLIGVDKMGIAFDRLNLSLQENIKLEDINYRVDFMIEAKIKDKLGLYIIECDGHEFHEKTKEQVMRDKKRDRRFMANGYTVIRFTGTEINRNTFGCAREVFEIILESLKGKL